MLLQFNVSNAISFKREVILDLVAGTDTSHEDNLLLFNKTRVLPSVAIYGANAAGKSNLFKALTSAIMFVRLSHNMQVDSRIPITPFLLDDEGRKSKTRFDFIYEYKGVKYEYGFVTDTMRVYEEYLYEYKTAKPSMIFERDNVNEYSYTMSLKNTMRKYEEKNTDNKLFLSTATNWNCKETEDAYLWFSEMIDTYDATSLQATMADALDSEDSVEIKDFVMKNLKAADFNISDYDFKVKTGRPETIALPPGIKIEEGLLENVKHWELSIHHRVDNKGIVEEIALPYYEESSGTQLFFAYCPAVYRALKTGKTVVIDEIDNNLHPMLVQYILELFNNKDTNPNGAQLIFNTHDIHLLDLDLMRRDQIYFVEKDNRNGVSDLYALSDFSPRKTDKIQKGYMLGRYGAIPNIGGIEW